MHNRLTINHLNAGLKRVSQTLNQHKLPIIRLKTGAKLKHLHKSGIKYHVFDFGIWRKWSKFESVKIV